MTAPYVCVSCNVTLPNDDKSTVIEHVENSHVREQCIPCGVKFLGRKNTAAHIRDSHPPVRNGGIDGVCGTCHALCGVAQAERHFDDVHVSRWCDECSMPFAKSSVLLKHHLESHRQNLFKLPLPPPLQSLTAVAAPLQPPQAEPRSPIRDVNGRELSKHTCDHCPAVFPNYTMVRKHYEQCHPALTCPPCKINVVGVVPRKKAIIPLKRELKLEPDSPPRAFNNNISVSSLCHKQSPTPATVIMKKAPRMIRHKSLVKPPSPTLVQQSLYFCPKCCYGSPQKSNLHRHFESFHVTFKCRECSSEVAGGRRKLWEHLKAEHPELVVPGVKDKDNPDFRYDGLEDGSVEAERLLCMNKREASKANSDSYGCSECQDSSVTDIASFIDHICSDRQSLHAVKSPNSKHQCPYCPDKVDCHQDLIEHVRSEHDCKGTFIRRNSTKKDKPKPAAASSQPVASLVDLNKEVLKGSDTDSVPEPIVVDDVPPVGIVVKRRKVYTEDLTTREKIRRMRARFKMEVEEEALMTRKQNKVSEAERERIWNMALEKITMYEKELPKVIVERSKSVELLEYPNHDDVQVCNVEI